MTTTRRTKVRKSVLALMVAYLRDQTTDTTKFTCVSGVTGAYPFSRSVWSFVMNGEFYQVAEMESAWPPSRRSPSVKASPSQLPALVYGVSLEFGLEEAAESLSMPQMYTLALGIAVRTQRSVVATQENPAQQIALLVDQALFRSNGRAEIKDYDQSPTVSTKSFATWQRQPRGSWEYYPTDGPYDDLRRVMTIEYSQPQDEW